MVVSCIRTDLGCKFVVCESVVLLFFFFFNDTATTEIYTLSLHDALPIFEGFGDTGLERVVAAHDCLVHLGAARDVVRLHGRSEEHTSELQSQFHLVCRLLLEKKKKKIQPQTDTTLTQQPKPSTTTLTATL